VITCKCKQKSSISEKMQKKITNPLTGETLSMSKWAKKLGINSTVLSWRLKNWSIEEALNTSNTKPDRFFTHPTTKETLSASEWAKKLNMHRNSLIRRIDILKWPLDKALSEPSGVVTTSIIVIHPLTQEALSQTQWALKLDKARSAIQHQIKAGIPLELVLATKEELDEIEQQLLTHPLTGETLSLADWAKRLVLKNWQLYARLKNPEWSLEDALTLPFQGEKAPNR
jgi:hypothetical protein